MWKPKFGEDESPSMEAAIFQAIGAASVCWNPMDGTGVFDDASAKEIGLGLIEFI